MVCPGGCTTRHHLAMLPRLAPPCGTPGSLVHLATSASSAPSRRSGSGTRSTSIESARKTPPESIQCWRPPGQRGPDASRSVVSTRGFSADVDLRDVILADWPEVDLSFEAMLSEQFRQIRAELGEDRVPPVAAGMTDPRGSIFDRAVRPNDRTRECLLSRGKHRHREDMPAARSEHAVDLTKGGVQVGHVLERL